MNDGLAYAENQLGVNKVYQESLTLLGQYDDMLTRMDKAVDDCRSVESRIEDRQLDLMIEERGKHPDHSEAAFARHMKEVSHKDPTLIELRARLVAAVADRSGTELEMKLLERQINVSTARMHELGGLLTFYAALKQAELTQQNNSANSTTQPQETQQ